MPERIVLSRKKGWRMPPNTKKVDRSTRWGNPFNATQVAHTFYHTIPMPIVYFNAPPGLDRCIDLYIAYLFGVLKHQPDFLEPLRGKDLACWCKAGAPCHADILLRLANGN